ncbi:MAG: flavodoxin-dependent (E)-4-hydroxy-3-methylbut-2-enyl-diphosphate synthase [Alphaproteobacteria bacterium]|nr:flavodoxin-dependent (E)-4-hydroxy-3-methylbut-2-enyl-diphosphate synthase [Alphaproteobacteria bacterium]MBE8219900.1 flavodoxin-dependent (E)-4-hydroxy-3-methylbut-2-enyl-diphosphate synthase [Alphaproteobacteria bacterium]
MALSSEHYPWRNITRRKTRQIMVGDVVVGGDAPIAVQSMTNTPTSDAAATIEQINAIAEAGADIVRVSCPDEASTNALRMICEASPIPVIADIHFHYRRAIEAAEAGAAALRINPGNIGDAKRVGEVVAAARAAGCSMRIGVNAGSLEKHFLDKYKEPCPEAMVESALSHVRILQEHNFDDYKISVKASDVFLSVAAYRQLSAQIDCPLHIGITEAGSLMTGAVKSSIGLGQLLMEGIGDTIRVSLSADPVEEVRVAYEILKSLGLRHRGVSIIACPSCARQGFDVIATVRDLEMRLAHIKTPLTLSIIGCVVNGPGEARTADIGFTGGGHGAGMVYVEGKPDHKLPHNEMVEHLARLVEEKVAQIELATEGMA